MPRILLTGGAGFLGASLTKVFEAEGRALRLLDVAPRPEWCVAPGVDYRQGDVRDAATVAAALDGVDAVIHAAFASPRQPRQSIESVNVGATRQLCAAAAERGVRRFVLISSTIVTWPPKAHPLFANAPLSRLDLYRSTRARAEEIVSECAGQGLCSAIVRPKTFVGPGRLTAFTILFDRIRRGAPAIVLGRGDCRYQLVHIEDMAEGIRRLAASTVGGVFCLGAAEFGTVREDLQALLAHAATGARLAFVPTTLARAGLGAMELACLVPASEWHYATARGADSTVDISRAVNELGWQPRWSNRAALCDAYDWYCAAIAAAGEARSIHPLPATHRALEKILDVFLR
jgi:nucleoside-diphosphate-sugar epimerase